MSRFLEVWGDTVDSRHLSASIALGIGIATPAFLISERVFAATVENAALARSYALLVGLVGCLVAGYVSSRFFRPKRIVREQAATEAGYRAVLDEIESEYGPLGDPTELAPRVQAELHALGLYDVFESEHKRRAAILAKVGAE